MACDDGRDDNVADFYANQTTIRLTRREALATTSPRCGRNDHGRDYDTLLLCSLPSGFSVASGRKRERMRCGETAGVGGGDRCAIFSWEANGWFFRLGNDETGPVAVLGPPYSHDDFTTFRLFFFSDSLFFMFFFSIANVLSFCCLPLVPIPLLPRGCTFEFRF